MDPSYGGQAPAEHGSGDLPHTPSAPKRAGRAEQSNVATLVTLVPNAEFRPDADCACVVDGTLNPPIAMKPSLLVRNVATLLATLITAGAVRATTYYVNNSTGNNANSGTSSSSPWADFTNVNTHTFAAGDTLSLACGCTWNQEMDISGSGSSWSSPITITSYGTGSLPKIQRSSGANDRTIKLTNPSYVQISNLEICDAGDGIQARWSAFGNAGLHFYNLYIHDIDVVMNHSPSTTDNIEYSFGIDLQNAPTFTTVPGSSQYLCSDVQIANCQFGNVNAAWGTFDMYNISGVYDSASAFQNVTVTGCWVHDCACDAAVVDATNVLVAGNYMDNLATAALPQGTTAIFQWRTESVTYLNNVMDTVPNTSSPDEVFLDCEAYVNNTYFGHNLVQNTAGRGVEFLQLPAGSNPPRNPSTDHNTNNYVWSNAFLNNGGSALGTTEANGNTVTGSLWNNVYYEPSSGFENGSFSGFSDNGTDYSVSASSNIYNVSYQFSPSTQGSNQWHYGYWNGSSWNDSTTFIGTAGTWNGASAYSWSDGSNGLIGQFTLLPDTNGSYWVAMSWVAPRAGTIKIRGRVYLTDSAGGTGVTALVYQNGATNRQLWPSASGGQSLASSYSQRGYDTDLDSITVAAGDVIHFCVGTSSGTNAHDLVGWSPTVVYQ